MSKAWTLFLPEVNVESYGAPRILQTQVLRNIAIDFCERTKAWLQVQPEYTLSAGKLDYAFALDANTIVHQIMSAQLVNGTSATTDVTPRSPAWCDENYPGWKAGAQTGKPVAVTQLGTDSFIPVPSDPGLGYQIQLTVALKPPRLAPLCPDILYNEYYMAMVNGALAKLLIMKGKGWANPERASICASMYEDAIVSAVRQQEKGFGRARHRVKPNYV